MWQSGIVAKWQTQGIIITQPITDEERAKPKRLIRDNDLHVQFSKSRFLHNLLGGKAVINEIGMPLLHFNAGDVISLTDLL